MTTSADCTLCAHSARAYCADRRRRFYHCDHCGLVFAEPGSHLDAAAEKAVYDLHENDPADGRYRAFLARLAEPLRARLTPGMEGLDYGCGPGPTLGGMLREAGMRMHDYDPLYRPDARLLARQYDFVTCTEVVEHFREPAREWRQLAALVRPGGWLGIMTWMLAATEVEAFQAWGYKGDPTHVAFYRPRTLQWLGRELGFEVDCVDERVILMRRHAGAGGAG